MITRVIYKIVLFTALFYSSQLKAQISGVSLIGFPDSVALNQSISFGVIIKNEDTLNAFSGLFSINFITDYMISKGDSSISFFDTTTIAAGQFDTITFTNYDVDSIKFKTGNNSILIWPEANGIKGDTIKKDVLVYISTGILGPDIVAEKMNIYPNPAQTAFSIENKSKINSIENVRIYTIIGCLVHEEPYQNNATIPLVSFPNGTYIIEIQWQNGERIIEKLLKY